MPRKAIVIELRCTTCGRSPERDEAQSNHNWSYYSTTCKCGGYVKPEVK